MQTDITRHHPGTAIKAIGDDGKVGGYLVVWGNKSIKDLQGEYFTPETDFALDWFQQRPMLYHHGLDGEFKTASIGAITHLKSDNIGIWAEAQLDMHKRYISAVQKLVQEGALHWSSGSLAHLVEVEEDGQIKRWPLVEGSMTPTPAEPRNTDIKAIKSAYDELGLDFTRLSYSSDSTMQKPKEVANPKEAHGGVKADNNFDSNTITYEGIKMTNEEFKQLVADEVKSAVAKMTGGGEPVLPEEDEAKMESDLSEEVMSKMEDEIKGLEEDENGAEKSINLNAVRATARKAILESLPTVLENTLNARRQYDDQLRSIAQKSATARARKEAPVKSQAGFGDNNPTTPRNVQVRSKFERAGWTPEDYSFAATLAGGTKSGMRIKSVSDLIENNKQEYARGFADSALKAYNAGALNLPAQAVKTFMAIKDDEVMYSTLSGFGDENVPTVWSDQIWDKPRVPTVIQNVIRNIEMPSNPYEYPVESTDPTVYFVGESANSSGLSLDATAPAIPRTQLGTAKVTFNAKKLGMHIPISAELEEDGLTRLIPAYREQSEKALLEAQDNVAFNGDVSTTGNINSDGETISATDRKYQAYDGLLHQALVTSTAQKVDAGGASPTLAHLRSVRAKLGNQIKGNPRNLAIVCDPSTYIALLGIDAVLTIDKYGEQATVKTGELGSIDGIPVFVSDQMALADADGKVTQSANEVDRGRLLMFHTPSWLLGYRRRINQNLTFIPYFDTHVLTMTLRNSLVGRTYSDGSQQATDDTAAILYNIGV